MNPAGGGGGGRGRGGRGGGGGLWERGVFDEGIRVMRKPIHEHRSRTWFAWARGGCVAMW